MTHQTGSRHAPPKASAMIEALRGLGYDTSTALADIIDNSVAAGAKNIWLDFRWSEQNSTISILDDGKGMSAEELDLAMRLGGKSPLEQRSPHDLGRFGLGLKTASFSQCRRLTVSTVHPDDGFQCLRWDLDDLGPDGNSWLLHEGYSRSAEPLIHPLVTQGLGTLVLWENLDRILVTDYKLQNFLDLCDKVERHLSMVFHRYLEKNRIKIFLNGKSLLGWDPFMQGHPAKPWVSPETKAPGFNSVIAQCHVLPHKDRLTEKEYLEAQGVDGWTAQQGFYVYRNERLLVSGSWLGLGQGRSWTKDEAHRLARIRVDIPNTSDSDWKIDVRKSVARPPVKLRPWLVRLAEETRGKARRAFAHRGKPRQISASDKVVQAWKAEHSTSGIRYKIDKDHAAVRGVLDRAGPLLKEIEAMLRVVEETVPVQKIWLDTAENHETPRTSFDALPPEDVITVLTTLFSAMVKQQGMSPEVAKSHLITQEPFNLYPDMVKNLTIQEL